MEDQNFSSNLAAWEENKEYKEKVLKLKEDLKRAGQQRALRAEIQEEKMKARHECARCKIVFCVVRRYCASPGCESLTPEQMSDTPKIP